MNTIVIGRIAKFVALFGFFLPWAVFSCSGQEFATMSGFDVASGHIHTATSMSGQPQDQNIGVNIFVIVALIVLALGLLGSFTSDIQNAARTLIMTGIAALAASFFGVMWLKGSFDRAVAEQARRPNQSYESQLGAGVASMIEIKEQYGYFLTIVGSGVAAACGGLALSGGQVPSIPSGLAEIADIRRRPEDDIADWDRIANKDDPDQLQEYLLRHPSGRFAELARMKLERLGVEPLKAPRPSPAPQAAAPIAPAPPTPSFDVAAPQAYESAADPYASESERKGLPVAAIALIAAVALGAVAFGGFAVLKNNEAQRQAAAAQQAVQAAEQAEATQRQQLGARIGACGAHSEHTDLTVVMQDCGDLVWSGDQNARTTATARLQAAANHREPAADEPLPAVPPIFVDHGGCPFEGCQYGVWSARAVNVLYDAPDGNAIGSIEVGDTIIAWRGDVYTTPLSGAVRRTNGAYQQGDQVYLLTYQGEGFYRIWRNGVISAMPEQVGGDCSKDDCTFDFGGAEQQRHWWVQVRRQDGRVGWLLDPHDFDGMDAFG